MLGNHLRLARDATAVVLEAVLLSTMQDIRVRLCAVSRRAEEAHLRLWIQPQAQVHQAGLHLRQGTPPPFYLRQNAHSQMRAADKGFDAVEGGLPSPALKPRGRLRSSKPAPTHTLSSGRFRCLPGKLFLFTSLDFIKILGKQVMHGL